MNTTLRTLAVWFCLGSVSTTALSLYREFAPQPVAPTFAECHSKWRAIPDADANAALQKLDPECQRIVWGEVVKSQERVYSSAPTIAPTP